VTVASACPAYRQAGIEKIKVTQIEVCRHADNGGNLTNKYFIWQGKSI